MCKRSGLQHGFRGVAFLLFYAVLFLSQINSSLYARTSGVSGDICYVVKKGNSNPLQVIRCVTSHTGKMAKHFPRINKRYYPEKVSFPKTTAFTPESPSIPVVKPENFERPVFVRTFHFVIRTRRGPPFVA